MDEELYVCDECIDDADIQELINDLVKENECSFCGRVEDEPCAAPIEPVGELIRECVTRTYTDPANVLSYESREGGYQGSVYDTEELLYDVVGLHLPNDDGQLIGLISGIVDYTGADAWCEENYYGTDEDDMLIYSWQGFCNLVMRSRRFFFNSVENDPDDHEKMSPSQLFEILRRAIVRHGLINELTPSEKLHRVRFVENGEKYTLPHELGPPPEELATQANRMSPPGIPMFYCAHSLQTALRETVNEAGTFCATLWHVTEAKHILDLTRLPRPVGFFNNDWSLDRDTISFLHRFVGEFSKPIERDRSTRHVDYIPTQAFTEFVRYMNENTDAPDIMGIRYPSAVDAGSSLVLFATQTEIVGGKVPDYMRSSPWIAMSKRHEMHISTEKLAEWQQEPEQTSLWGFATRNQQQ